MRHHTILLLDLLWAPLSMESLMTALPGASFLNLPPTAAVLQMITYVTG
jgi:hypothetical protein